MAIFDQIPFIKRDNRRTAFANDQIGNLQILFFKRDRCIKHDDNNLSKANRTQAIGNGKLFELFLRARFAAQTGSVEKLDVASAPFPVNGNRVTRDTGFRAGQQTVFAKHRIDHGGLARIRTSNNGYAQWLGCIVFRYDFFIRVFDIIAYQLTDCLRREDFIGCFFFTLICKDALFAQKLDNRVAQIRHALTMLSRDRARLTQTKLESIIKARLRTACF
ncbi:hypothetical protein D9M69_517370 [compost metagenome]